MQHPALTLTWLIGLSLITTLLARFALGGMAWVSVAFLILAGWKARVILNGYLGLSTTRFWRRGFNTFISVFLIGIAALWLVPIL